MDRTIATKYLRSRLDSQGLHDWKLRLNTDISWPFFGLCDHEKKTIFVNAHHIDTHDEKEVENTINHEVAHAVVGPGNGHNEIWQAKALELGCYNTEPCASFGLSPAAIDAIRSGAQLELTFEEQVIRKPKYTINILRDKCPECGKVAEELFSFDSVDKEGNEIKMITLKCFHIIKKIIPKATPFEKFITFAHRDNGCPHEWDKNHCLKCNAYRLFPFQVEGCRFIERAFATNKGAGIFDQQGLGKTMQAIGFTYHHPEALPLLVVAKSGLRYQWFKQFILWGGPTWIGQIISTSRDPILPGFKVYFISFDLLRRFDKKEFDKVKFKTVIIDEVQHIKNPDSTRTGEVRKLVKDAQIIELSGTPWKNRGSEYFVALNLLSPVKFPSYQGFLNSWVDYYFDGQYTKMGGIRKIAQFKEYTKDIVLRRERHEVLPELPLINRTKLYTDLDALNQEAYDESVSEFVKWYNSAVIGGEEESLSGIHILAKMSRMRHITGLAKIPATVARVEEYIENGGQKVIIFVHHKDVGELMMNELRTKFSATHSVMQIKAELSGEERDNVQNRFNDATRAILVASTLASGEGLNLQTADFVIMHERQWNPANEEQAEDRICRIGQVSKQLTGEYVTAAGTIDEKLDSIVENKRVHFHNTMNKGERIKWNEGDIAKELAASIVGEFNKRRKITQFATL